MNEQEYLCFCKSLDGGNADETFCCCYSVYCSGVGYHWLCFSQSVGSKRQTGFLSAGNEGLGWLWRYHRSGRWMDGTGWQISQRVDVCGRRWPASLSYSCVAAGWSEENAAEHGKRWSDPDQRQWELHLWGKQWSDGADSCSIGQHLCPGQL